MQAETPYEKKIANLALSGAILMLTILAMSATIRLTHDPCAGSVTAATAATAAASNSVAAIARGIHRVSAMLVSVVLILLTAFSLRARPMPLSRIARIAALFLLTLFLAILGRAGAGSSVPAIPLLNVAAGMAMLALFWTARLDISTRPLFAKVNVRRYRLVRITVALVVVQIWIGATIAGLLATSCNVSTGLDRLVLWPNHAAWQALSIFHAPSESVSAISDAIAWLLLLHKLNAALLVLLGLKLAIGLLRMEKKFHAAGAATLLLLGAQIVLGLAMAAGYASAWLGVAHNAMTGLLLATLVGIRYQFGRAC